MTDSVPTPQATVTVEATVNGDDRSATVPADTLLSAFLRESLSLTGTHRGCESGKCGACTVLLDGEPVKSCNLLAAQVTERSVTTVEGLTDGTDLHPVQSAFWDTHGLQCGYCTPGFLTSTVALLREEPDPDVETIREWFAGNVCRCTGYTKIVESVQVAAERLREGDGEPATDGGVDPDSGSWAGAGNTDVGVFDATYPVADEEGDGE
ncbi:(2Fe-2S)-binding protein [Salinigranum salinum]|uniref:(2Fe-2S)-binding protein n=1 Tax=Salinigranum salinum TaxID=1364937 RepID=UPI00126123DA|nr:(2Fe-2S)-binding protein [Salinigranum salinum]